MIKLRNIEKCFQTKAGFTYPLFICEVFSVFPAFMLLRRRERVFRGLAIQLFS